MDPDEREIHRQQTVTARQRLAQIEQVKQTVQPFVQAARSGNVSLGQEAGNALLTAIRQCLDELDDARRATGRITQNTKLGTSPDAQVITKFNKEVAAGGSNSAMTALASLEALLKQAEVGVTEAMRQYRQMDGNAAHDIRRAGG